MEIQSESAMEKLHIRWMDENWARINSLSLPDRQSYSVQSRVPTLVHQQSYSPQRHPTENPLLNMNKATPHRDIWQRTHSSTSIKVLPTKQRTDHKQKAPVYEQISTLHYAQSDHRDTGWKNLPWSNDTVAPTPQQSSTHSSRAPSCYFKGIKRKQIHQVTLQMWTTQHLMVLSEDHKRGINQLKVTRLS